MNYYICQDWKSTSGNHAGMVHLCKSIEKLDSDNNKTIVVRKDWHEVKIIRRFRKYIYNFDLFGLIYFFVTLSLIPRIRKNDRIFLMEYLHKDRNQQISAKLIRFFYGKKVSIFGMVHLFSDKLTYWFSDSDIVKWSMTVDKILTLGSSLTKYLSEKGIPSHNIITTFHYVDRNYYVKNVVKIENNPLKVIAMGNLYRNYDLLKQIVEKLPEVEFLICKGHDDIESLFLGLGNVKLYGYITEDELKRLMEMADVSLNVLNDTIGSNVITTSMSMELAMIVSEVGSIRDYCDETNALFCANTEDFIQAIQKLNSDREFLNLLKHSSLNKSIYLSVNYFYKQLKNW